MRFVLSLHSTPSYSLNFLESLCFLFDSLLSPLIPLIFYFLSFDSLFTFPTCFFFLNFPLFSTLLSSYCFVVLLPLVGGIPKNIGSGPTSVGSSSFIFFYFQVCF